MTPIPTYARRIASNVDPLAAFRELTRDGADDGCVLFETADRALGGRSLIASKPALSFRARTDGAVVSCHDAGAARRLDQLRGRLAQFDTSVHGGELRVEFGDDARSSEARLNPPALQALRAFATTFEPSRKDLDLCCLGGMSFELVDHVERLPSLDRSEPDIVFHLPQELIVIDHDRGFATVIEFDFAGHGEFACGERLVEVCARLETLRSAPTVRDSAKPLDVVASMNDAEFGGAVERARRHIIDGDVFQVVLSRAFQAPCPSPLDAYAALRRLNPSPYMFYFGGPEILFGASPETSLRVTGDKVEIRPIAGTRRRGLRHDGGIDRDSDSRIEADLRLDQKEVAEHMMLVDLARNDIARVSRPGTRRVDRLMGVDRYSTVMHLVSHVSGQLRPECDALHAYAAAMNMGTLTGAPKVRATELLREFEGEPRGFYGGAVGFLTHRGDMDTAIVIRSATVRDGTATVRAGAGIVHDSDPASEADETRRKADSVLTALAATASEVAA